MPGERIDLTKQIAPNTTDTEVTINGVPVPEVQVGEPGITFDPNVGQRGDELFADRAKSGRLIVGKYSQVYQMSTEAAPADDRQHRSVNRRIPRS